MYIAAVYVWGNKAAALLGIDGHDGSPVRVSGFSRPIHAAVASECLFVLERVPYFARRIDELMLFEVRLLFV